MAVTIAILCLARSCSSAKVYNMNTDNMKMGRETNTQQCIVPVTGKEWTLPSQITLCIRYRVDVEVASWGNSPNPVFFEMGYR